MRTDEGHGDSRGQRNFFAFSLRRSRSETPSPVGSIREQEHPLAA
jgi:hypothetical protein